MRLAGILQIGYHLYPTWAWSRLLGKQTQCPTLLSLTHPSHQAQPIFKEVRRRGEDKREESNQKKKRRRKEMVETCAFRCSGVLPACVVLHYQLRSFGHQFSTTMTRSTEIWGSPCGGGAPCHLLRELLSCIWMGPMAAINKMSVLTEARWVDGGIIITVDLLLQRRDEHDKMEELVQILWRKWQPSLTGVGEMEGRYKAF